MYYFILFYLVAVVVRGQSGTDEPTTSQPNDGETTATDLPDPTTGDSDGSGPTEIETTTAEPAPMCNMLGNYVYVEVVEESQTPNFYVKYPINVEGLTDTYIYTTFTNVDSLTQASFGFSSDDAGSISQIKDTCTDYNENTEVLSLSCLINRFGYHFDLEAIKSDVMYNINPTTPAPSGGDDETNVPGTVETEEPTTTPAPENQNGVEGRLLPEGETPCFIRNRKEYDDDGSLMLLPTLFGLFIIVLMI